MQSSFPCELPESKHLEFNKLSQWLQIIEISKLIMNKFNYGESFKCISCFLFICFTF